MILYDDDDRQRGASSNRHAAPVPFVPTARRPFFIACPHNRTRYSNRWKASSCSHTWTPSSWKGTQRNPWTRGAWRKKRYATMFKFCVSILLDRQPQSGEERYLRVRGQLCSRLAFPPLSRACLLSIKRLFRNPMGVT